MYFAPGLYDPTTRAGVERLGHELTHVVQQRDGRVPMGPANSRRNLVRPAGAP
ncbi:MAG TPA: DUF4157 domain-containing protein [Kofleriaceae bacterium]|nr:DUF4157 domain-containing protein [Kofleriaceae bacterium]